MLVPYICQRPCQAPGLSFAPPKPLWGRPDPWQPLMMPQSLTFVDDANAVTQHSTVYSEHQLIKGTLRANALVRTARRPVHQRGCWRRPHDPSQTALAAHRLHLCTSALSSSRHGARSVLCGSRDPQGCSRRVLPAAPGCSISFHPSYKVNQDVCEAVRWAGQAAGAGV